MGNRFSPTFNPLERPESSYAGPNFNSGWDLGVQQGGEDLRHKQGLQAALEAEKMRHPELMTADVGSFGRQPTDNTPMPSADVAPATHAGTDGQHNSGTGQYAPHGEEAPQSNFHAAPPTQYGPIGGSAAGMAGGAAGVAGPWQGGERRTFTPGSSFDQAPSPQESGAAAVPPRSTGAPAATPLEPSSGAADFARASLPTRSMRGNFSKDTYTYDPTFEGKQKAYGAMLTTEGEAQENKGPVERFAAATGIPAGATDFLALHPGLTAGFPYANRGLQDWPMKLQLQQRDLTDRMSRAELAARTALEVANRRTESIASTGQNVTKRLQVMGMIQILHDRLENQKLSLSKLPSVGSLQAMMSQGDPAAQSAIAALESQYAVAQAGMGDTEAQLQDYLKQLGDDDTGPVTAGGSARASIRGPIARTEKPELPAIPGPTMRKGPAPAPAAAAAAAPTTSMKIIPQATWQEMITAINPATKVPYTNAEVRAHVTKKYGVEGKGWKIQ